MKQTKKDTNKQISLHAEIFDYNYNEGLVHQVVVACLNNLRSGNSAQKTRAEVRGGGKKPWKQKGTGRARAGSIRSPLWRSGGVVFASKKRDYSQKVNKKMYKRALRSIISELHRSGNLIVVEDFKTATHKTKDFLAQMKTYELTNALIIVHEMAENDYLACRNLIDYEVCDVISIDPLNLLRFEKVLVTEAAINDLVEVLQ